MKKQNACINILLLCLVFLCILPGSAETRSESEVFHFRWIDHQENGLSNSQMLFPECISDDPENAALIAKINQEIQSAAHISEYLQLLQTIQDGGTGLHFSYDTSNYGKLDEQGQIGGSRYVSLLFSAEGKMLKGRPSQIYYPLTLDLRTGEQVPFEALFTNPDGAKAFIETYLENVVGPNLSTYLENNQLFPVPYDRFFLDGFGNLIFVYEHDQLSFLSGQSGAVAFRYSELWDWLDTSPDGVPMEALWGISDDFTAQYIPHPEKWSMPDLLKTSLEKGRLPGLKKLLPPIGTPLEEVFDVLKVTGDSDYYPGGACYEVEEPTLRGALLLTDANESRLTGILTSRVDCYGIETGKTMLEEAVALIGSEPAVRLPLDETAADMYRVCPGTLAMYQYALSPETNVNSASLSFTLYADEAGIVQYLKIEIK